MEDETQLWSRPDGGRQEIDEIDEDARATPIFAALVRGGWRQRQAVEAEQFRRDPLTAPFPSILPSTMVPLAVVSPTGPASVPSPARGGRHHLHPRLLPHYV